MADHADGSIIVDTELDAQGFRAGSTELQQAIKSLSTKVEALGPTFQRALSGNIGAMSTFDSKAAALENTISQLEAKLESLGNTRVPTEDYQWLTAEIEKANNELSKYAEKQAKLEALGVNEDSRAWQSLQYDIDLAKQKIADYKSEQASMREDGTAFQMGSSTAEYAKLESALSSAKSRLAEMRSEAESAGQSTSRLGGIGNFVKSAFSKIGQAGAAGFKKLVGGVKSAISHFNIFKRSSGGAEGAIGKLGKKLTGVWNMFKRMALRKVISAIISGLKDGMNNLAQYSSGVNSNLSTLKSGLTQLKNSFATAFAPILTAVTPILSTLINYISAAVTWIGKLFAAFTGAKTFTKAKAVQEDYAASLKNTGSAAKDAKKQLAGFDDLNVLSDSSSSSSGNSGGASPSEMFEEVPIESGITDFVSKIKEAFKNGDYGEIGKILGTKINEAFQKIDEYIKWDNVGGKITKGIKGFATAFNSLIYTIDWALIGKTLADGINTVINTLYLIVTEIDWPALAGGIAKALSNMITGIDWAKLGTLLSTWVRVLLQSIRSAIQNFDWLGIGKSIATCINNIDWVGILSDLAGAVSDLVKAALDLLIGFAENLDWEKLGKDLWNSLIGVIKNIDWSGIVSKAFRLLGSVIAGSIKLVIGLGKAVWESLKSGFEATKAYFSKYIKDAGGNVIKGLWNGIVDALKGVGNWIVKNIWDPFITGFKNAFGIHSPSTKMSEMGGHIITGLWNGIKGAWHSITEFFSRKLEGIKNTISGAWTSIKTTATQKWSDIKSGISTAWDGLKTTASTKWSNLKSTISGAWDSVKTTATQKWDTIKSSLSTAWEGIKTTASTKWSNLKSTISGAWDNIKTSASDKWSNIKSTLSSSWDTIKTTASTKFGSVKDAISGKFTDLKSLASTWGSHICDNLSNGIKNGIKKVGDAAKSVASKIKSLLGFSEPEDGPLSDFHTYMPDMIDLMTKGIKSNQGKAIGAVSNMADAISDEMKNGDYSLSEITTGKGIEKSLVSFSDTIADSFSSLMDRLQSIADRVTFSMPVVAKTGAVPYSVRAAEASGTGNSISNAIEASNDELASVVIQAVANATTAIVGAIQNYSGTTVNLDSDKLATNVIKEINRRTRRSGVSPIIG